MRLQFGTRGCYLTITKESRNKERLEFSIGDRYDISRLILKHERMGIYDLRGVWYVFEYAAVSETIYSYTLIRNSKDLCLSGDGKAIRASDVEHTFNIKGYKPEMDFYLTFEPSIAKYKTIVRAATKLKFGAFPIFYPDGQVYIVNIYSRPITDPLTYKIIVGGNLKISYEYEVNRMEDYKTYKFIMNEYTASNVFYPPGTIITIDDNSPQALFITNIIVTADQQGNINQSSVHAFLVNL